MGLVRRRRIGRIAVIVGIAGVVLAGWLAGARALFLRDSRVVHGRVVSAESKDYVGYSDDEYGQRREVRTTLTNLVVRYEVDGRSYALAVGPTHGDPGTEVEVRYAAANPAMAEVTSLSRGFMAPLFLVFTGGALVVAGRRRLMYA